MRPTFLGLEIVARSDAGALGDFRSFAVSRVLPMQILRRYWIAALVMLLVMIHAVIIGYVRSEARQVKVNASQEIPLGVYYVQSADKQWMSQLRIHVLVTRETRLAAKTNIEMNRWLIHQAVEEKLRQIDPSLLADPVLLEIKTQIKTVVDEALAEELVDQVVINDRVDFPLHHFQARPAYDLTAIDPLYQGKPVHTPIKPGDEVEGHSSHHVKPATTADAHGEADAHAEEPKAAHH